MQIKRLSDNHKVCFVPVSIVPDVDESMPQPISKEYSYEFFRCSVAVRVWISVTGVPGVIRLPIGLTGQVTQKEYK
jgi:hypothetical protein